MPENPFSSVINSIIGEPVPMQILRAQKGYDAATGSARADLMKTIAEIAAEDPNATQSQILNKLLPHQSFQNFVSKATPEEYQKGIPEMIAAIRPQAAQQTLGDTQRIVATPPPTNAGELPQPVTVQPSPASQGVSITHVPENAPASIITPKGGTGEPQIVYHPTVPYNAAGQKMPSLRGQPGAGPQSTPGTPGAPPLQFKPTVDRAEQDNELPAGLLPAVLWKESRWNPRAVSPTGVHFGLGQLGPEVRKQFGVTDPFNPEQNINAAAGYLKENLSKYNGNVAHALMAYNWGPGKVDAWLKRGSNPNEVPAETRDYVRTIMGPEGMLDASPAAARINRTMSPENPPSATEAAFGSGTVPSASSWITNQVGQYFKGAQNPDQGAREEKLTTLRNSLRDYYRDSSKPSNQQAALDMEALPDKFWGKGPLAVLQKMYSVKKDIEREQTANSNIMANPQKYSNAVVEKAVSEFSKAETVLTQFGSDREIREGIAFTSRNKAKTEDATALLEQLMTPLYDLGVRTTQKEGPAGTAKEASTDRVQQILARLGQGAPLTAADLAGLSPQDRTRLEQAVRKQ